ncbi:MAG: protein translocase subunit SecD [Coxiella sp. (in: Bacteria)]|nr:MAG: protein translocase subunit SecD [Coxiella sp. (in: g-proteobacteria)]
MNKYPVWRYVLILVLIVFGVVYALPNWYGDDAAVQISIKGGATIPVGTTVKLQQALKQSQIGYKSVVEKDGAILVRLTDADTQAKAQDVIQAVLGNKYTVALNLAPRTPQWLQSIGAQPMKLGLDLRGGIHFLYQVDVKAMMKERIKSDMHSVGDELRSNMIRYTSISPLGENGFLLRFSNENARDQAQTLLKKDFQSFNFMPGQQGSTYTLALTMMPQALQQLKETAVSQNITVLNRRINALGVGESMITQQGVDQISIDLPGIQDTARAKQLLGAVATVRMLLQDTQHDAETAARTGIVPFGDTLYRFQGQPILLKNQVVLSGSSITSASTGFDQSGRPAVNITVSGDNVSYFNKITGANIGQPMATVFVQTITDKKLVNGKIELHSRNVEKIINIATINGALGRNFQIMGLQSLDYAKDLALQLQSGAYVAPLVPVAEHVVGPSMGQHNIEMGVRACEVGSLLVFIFMALYYRVFGLVADTALILNVVFVVAIQSLLGFVMTLPGIAALVLTVGMAVDANVLIDERIREELRLGMSPQAAIAAGYGRAFTTIVDANVTTLIVAAVLFALGTGAVQGFAVTLTIGLLTSMVTAIFFTRAFINLIYGRREKLKQLSIGIKV